VLYLCWIRHVTMILSGVSQSVSQSVSQRPAPAQLGSGVSTAPNSVSVSKRSATFTKQSPFTSHAAAAGLIGGVQRSIMPYAPGTRQVKHHPPSFVSPAG
jgi:hypothetical protein